jgi:hypothetical protein
MVMLLTTMVERNNRLFAMRTYFANLFDEGCLLLVVC